MKKQRTARRRGGFTLAETLMAILILLMVTSVVTAGLPTAVNAYQKVIDRANAQVQLSTTVTRLRDELGNTLWYKETDDALCYSNGSFAEKGYVSSLPKAIADGEDAQDGITITYANVYGTPLNASEPLLTALNTAAQNKRLYTIYDKLDYDPDKGTFTVENLRVRKPGVEADQARLSKLVILPVREPLQFPEQPSY